MPLSSVYLVNPTLKTATEGDLAQAESALKTRFPKGYASFVTTLGAGALCGFVRVYLPQRVIKENDEFRQRVDQYYCWDEGSSVPSRERVVESICIADTLNGDEVIFHPSDPSSLYLLPHDTETIFAIGSTLDAAIDWILESGELTFKPNLSTFDSGIGTQSVQLVSLKSRPSFARAKTALLKWGLHDAIEEPAESRRAREVTLFVKSIGGSIHWSGSGVTATMRLSFSCPKPNAALDDLLKRLEKVGFVPPVGDDGKPHPGLLGVRAEHFPFENVVPCPIPPAERQPRDVALAFVRAMHVWESGMSTWGHAGAGYPIALGHELIEPIFRDLGVPANNEFNFSYTNPSDYDAENEKVVSEKQLSADEVEVATLSNDHWKTQHFFVVRREEGMWRLSKVRVESRAHSRKIL